MYQTFRLLRIIMLCVFMVICAGLWAYQFFVVWPSRACEAKGHWWDSRDLSCAIPMPLSTWTGRPMSTLPKAEQKPERAPVAKPPEAPMPRRGETK